MPSTKAVGVVLLAPPLEVASRTAPLDGRQGQSSGLLVKVATSTVQGALRRRGLLLPTGFRADRRSWARLRKRVFRGPPRQRNRVWQMDFSEFETARGGIWRICAVIDYATYNTLRPHQALDERTPRAAYLAVEHCG
jgi:transposase InsO family protein